jgi:hypothetical protein
MPYNRFMNDPEIQEMLNVRGYNVPGLNFVPETGVLEWIKVKPDDDKDEEKDDEDEKADKDEKDAKDEKEDEKSADEGADKEDAKQEDAKQEDAKKEDEKEDEKEDGKEDAKKEDAKKEEDEKEDKKEDEKEDEKVDEVKDKKEEGKEDKKDDEDVVSKKDEKSSKDDEATTTKDDKAEKDDEDTSDKKEKEAKKEESGRRMLKHDSAKHADKSDSESGLDNVTEYISKFTPALWTSCNDDIDSAFGEDHPVSAVPALQNLMQKIRVFMYSGEFDLNTNLLGTEHVLEKNEWDGKEWSHAMRGLWW